MSQHQSGLVGWLPLRPHSGFSFLSLSLLLSLSSGKDSDLFSNIKESSKKDGPGTSKTRFCVSFVVQACSPSVSDRASKPIKRLRPYLSARCSLDSIESLLDPESCFFKVCNCRFSMTLLVSLSTISFSGWSVAHLILLVLFVVHLPHHLSPRPAPRLTNVDAVILIL